MASDFSSCGVVYVTGLIDDVAAERVTAQIRVPVRTYVTGKAVSFAALVFAAGERGKRAVAPHATVWLRLDFCATQTDMKMGAGEAIAYGIADCCV